MTSQICVKIAQLLVVDWCELEVCALTTIDAERKHDKILRNLKFTNASEKLPHNDVNGLEFLGWENPCQKLQTMLNLAICVKNNYLANCKCVF